MSNSKSKDIVLAWDFNFLNYLGANERLGKPKFEIISKPETDYLVRDGTDYFYSTIQISEGKFARLGFHVIDTQNMNSEEEQIHLTQTVIDFLKEQKASCLCPLDITGSWPLDVENETFNLLGEKVKYKLDHKNCISKQFLNLVETYSEPMTSNVDKRPIVTKNKFVTVTCFKILNGKNDEENKIQVNKNCSVNLG